ncbi:hypothetical protein FOS14_01820 [Skermania sp. ID1734]|uniref:hypothetical protein n=1 Tax=Skermania sp. ID1734 TaxID=2597516 RepID=UPI00117CDEFE|nr:hypothetical protein [Skermania sp. ID1734]TSE02143.1 hypothetical protein FOS14_01820 [Skermania sp. ID1734]
MTTRIRRLAAAPMAAAAIFTAAGFAVAVAPTAVAAPATPSPGELQAKLQSALNGDANELESGDAAALNVVRDRISQIPGYNWSVSGPVAVDGDALHATLHSRLGNYDYPVNLTWVDAGGTWKLSQASQDELVGMATLQNPN